MTKELYPRPKAKIGELVAFSHKDAKELVYHQMKVTGAYFKARWVYVGLASTFDSKKGYIRYGVVADEDEIVENFTTGAKLVDGEWVTGSSHAVSVLDHDLVLGYGDVTTITNTDRTDQHIQYKPSVDEFGLHKF